MAVRDGGDVEFGQKCEWRDEDRFDGAVTMGADGVVSGGEIVVDERLVLKVVVKRSDEGFYGDVATWVFGR